MTGYISKSPYKALSYEELVKKYSSPSEKIKLTKETYEKRISKFDDDAKDYDISRITYESDGLKITGVEVLPLFKEGEKAPLVIYNRGGNQEFGVLSSLQIRDLMLPFANQMRAGILASNYRGNDGSEGKEEFGGADVNDVLNLIKIGKQQPWWDGKNIFMLGASRGGMMTHLAIKHGAKLNAAATIGGVTDLFASTKERPEMEKTVESQLIPNWKNNREQEYKNRSVVYWADKINTPMLLLHGGNDWRVQPSHSHRLKELLSQQGKEVKHIEYAGDDHVLHNNMSASKDEIVDWFNTHIVI